MEARREGAVDWQQIGPDFRDIEDIFGIANFPIKTDSLGEGGYCFRISAYCFASGADLYDTTRLTPVCGTIDRVAPIRFGVSPANKLWKIGDEISISFNEPLDCTRTQIYLNAFFADAPTSGPAELVTLLQVCEGRKLLFAFTPRFLFDSIIGKRLRVEVQPKDKNLNPTLTPESWDFKIDNVNPERLIARMRNLRIDTSSGTFSIGTLLSEFSGTLGVPTSYFTVENSQNQGNTFVFDLVIQVPVSQKRNVDEETSNTEEKSQTDVNEGVGLGLGLGLGTTEKRSAPKFTSPTSLAYYLNQQVLANNLTSFILKNLQIPNTTKLELDVLGGGPPSSSHVLWHSFTLLLTVFVVLLLQ